jgi:hypothetical protein
MIMRTLTGVVTLAAECNLTNKAARINGWGRVLFHQEWKIWWQFELEDALTQTNNRQPLPRSVG